MSLAWAERKLDFEHLAVSLERVGVVLDSPSVWTRSGPLMETITRPSPRPRLERLVWILVVAESSNADDALVTVSFDRRVQTI